ncbi:MAG: DUF58 domain-containing protein [Bdellovibrionales bacterium]|nr:DUF58 domain-containing protein [Bdellovibrionales bacterium]
MRVVEARRFKDYFGRDEDEFDYSPGMDWDRFFYKNRRRFNRQWAVLLLLAAFALLGFWMREGWVLFFSTLVALAGLYYRTRAIAHGLYVARKLPARAREHHPVEIEYEVRNASEFSASHLRLTDFFTGSRRPLVHAGIGEGLAPLSVLVVKRRMPCDAGMGVHRFGPLTLALADPLGLFEFTVAEENPALLEVLPEYLAIDGFRVLESVDSSAVGMNESVHAGQSANFLGLREYVPGDPVKRINWRLSTRHQELVVNVFENMVHTDLTVCLDMDEENHIGRAGDNTWETCKDAVVSILHELHPRTHRMQLFSQAARLPYGRGTSHLLSLVQATASLAPVKRETGARPLLESVLPLVPYGSSLVYVVPIYRNRPELLARLLSIYQEQAVRCVVVLVEAKDYVQWLPAGLPFQAVMEKNREAVKVREEILRQCGVLGIPAYVVKRGQTISRALGKPVVN